MAELGLFLFLALIMLLTAFLSTLKKNFVLESAILLLLKFNVPSFSLVSLL